MRLLFSSNGTLQPSSIALESFGIQAGLVLGLEARHATEKGWRPRVGVKVLCECPVWIRSQASLFCPSVFAEPDAHVFNGVKTGRSRVPRLRGKDSWVVGQNGRASPTWLLALFLFLLPPPLTVLQNSHPLFVLCGLLFCPSTVGKGCSSHFHKQLNAGALPRAFSYLGSPFLEWFRAVFNLRINLTKVRNLLLENGLQSVVYLSSCHPLPVSP